MGQWELILAACTIPPLQKDALKCFPPGISPTPMYGNPPSSDVSPSTAAAGASAGADDDMSLFLRHLLSSSSTSPYPPAHLLSADRGKDPIRYPFSWDPPPDAADGGGRAGAESAEGDDYEWESEEGAEPAEEKPAAKPAAARSGPKRSRAAEVHNLSEKRRRSRINEKMKALQNLIPNSNKTDKASMLDEAIEYLKQLQLQVQMLSMRNGMSLYPMYMPGTMQSLQIPNVGNGFGTGDCPIKLNNLSIGNFPVREERQMAHGLPNQPFPSLQPLVLPNTLDIRKSTATSGLDVSRTLRAPFQLLSSSADLHGNESLPGQTHIEFHSRLKQTDKETNCLEGCMLEQTNLHLVGPNKAAQSEILIEQLDRKEDARQLKGPE